MNGGHKPNDCQVSVAVGQGRGNKALESLCGAESSGNEIDDTHEVDQVNF